MRFLRFTFKNEAAWLLIFAFATPMISALVLLVALLARMWLR